MDSPPAVAATTASRTDARSFVLGMALLGPLIAAVGWRPRILIGLLILWSMLAWASSQSSHPRLQEIRYLHHLTAIEVVNEMKQAMAKMMIHDEQQQQKKPEVDIVIRSTLVRGLAALAKKYGALLEQMNKKSDKTSHSTYSSTSSMEPPLDQMALLCLDVSLEALRLFGVDPTGKYKSTGDDDDKDDNNNSNDDAIVVGALSLLALIAKDSGVRQHFHDTPRQQQQQSDNKNAPPPLHMVLAAVHRSLERAQHLSQEQTLVEQQVAEVQRKACLWMGALADQHAGLAEQLVMATYDNDDSNHRVSLKGHVCILKALQWFRFHEGVANWGLWALFILCYEYPPTKTMLLDHAVDNSIKQPKQRQSSKGNDNNNDDAIPNVLTVVLDCLKNCPVLDVQRHGIALLFDLLREPEEQQQKSTKQQQYIQQVWSARQAAVAQGLHSVAVEAMRNAVQTQTSGSSAQTMDIYLMSRELLAGTNYQGEIPAMAPNMSSLVPS